MDKAFFGYGSEPPINRDTLHTAARLLDSTGLISATSWEDLRMDGQVIISKVLEEIDSSLLCAFDVTTLNPNVMFELGYALAAEKRLWLLLENADSSAKRLWEQFHLLQGIGYYAWANSDEIRDRFIAERPDQADSTLFDQLLASASESVPKASLFCLPAFHDSQPNRELLKRLDVQVDRGVVVLKADPTESKLEAVQWYAAKAYETNATIVHFESPRRELAAIHNARASFVAGLAHGLGRPLLMIADTSYEVPLDYAALLRRYESAAECRSIVDSWIDSLALKPERDRRVRKTKLALELRSLRFGEHVAENEVSALPDYFVETAAFDGVVSQRTAIFVGRKGTGKSANMYSAAGRLSATPENLVVVIKPAAYDFAGLVDLLVTLPGGLQSYSIEALWQFLLVTEIARATVEAIKSKPLHLPLDEEEQKLLGFAESAPFDLEDDFAGRLDGVLQAIAASDGGGSAGGKGRDRINEALHHEWIARLRQVVAPTLTKRDRVAVLVDNLDKGWERRANLPLLADLLLGLLSAVGRTERDFSRGDSRRQEIPVTLALFLRSDIFAYLQGQAREPDKMQVARVEWSDPQTLIRVIEERFLASRPLDSDVEELWTRFFCEQVRGIPTRDYLVSRVLPRPRDLIYFCNACIVAAIDRRHDSVEEEDVLAGERTYSQFAFEALLVENGITISEFEAVLFEFAGLSPIIAEDEALEAITKAGFREMTAEQVLGRLKAVSFLGVETAPGRFQFPDDGMAAERAEVLARKTAESEGHGPRLSIHPAFRAYLEVAE